MFSTIKRKAAEFIEEAFKRTLEGFHQDRLFRHVNNSATVQPFMRKMYMDYRMRVADGKPLPTYREAGFRVYSQYDEDGITMYLLAAVGMKTYKCIEIGSGDCVFASNTANLVNNFGFQGLFLDVQDSYLKRGADYYNQEMMTRIYPPKFVCSQVTRENINDLIGNQGFNGEVDFLSIDIDGNDFWVYEAINVVKPRVVVMECHVEFGLNNVVVPYDADYNPATGDPIYHGASVVALRNMMKKKGYKLVASNIYGVNNFFVLETEDTRNLLPEITVEEAMQHPRNAELAPLFDKVKDRPFETVAL